MAVFGLAVVLTAALTFAAAEAHDSNEDRLLSQQAAEGAAVLDAAIPAITAKANEIARVADLLGDDTDTLREQLLRDVGEGQRFATVTVERRGERLLSVGAPARLPDAVPEPSAPPETDAPGSPVNVTGVLDGDDPRIVYSVTAPQPSDLVIHAEQQLNPDRIDPDRGEGDAFEGIDHAIYLGTDETMEQLLRASRPDLPIEGRRAVRDLAFGDETMRFVVTPRGTLGGGLLARLPWLTAAGGLLLGLVAAGLVESLHRRRAEAERFSAELQERYDQEKTIADTLQRSLLPDHLERLVDIEVAARYFAGAEGTDIGGDWYDVVDHGDSYTVVVGDVVGRGVQAAAVMAAMRYATHALAGQRSDPADVLAAVNSLEHIRGDFVTMLCGTVEPATRSVRVATAGHPAPLLITPEETRFLRLPSGPPIGFLDEITYTTKQLTVPPGSVLVLFTDGLYERPGEHIDDGLERLRDVASRVHGSVEDILDQLADGMLGEGLRDDTAMLAIRIP